MRRRWRKAERLLDGEAVVECAAGDDDRSALAVRRPAPFGEEPLSGGEVGVRTVQRLRSSGESEPREADGRYDCQDGARDLHREGCGLREAPAGRRRAVGRRGIEEQHRRERCREAGAEERRALSQHGQRREREWCEAHLGRSERDDEASCHRGASARPLHEPVERIVDDEAEDGRSENERHQVDRAEADEKGERACERGGGERKGEKGDPPDGPEDEHRERGYEGERDAGEPADLRLAAGRGAGRVDGDSARGDRDAFRAGGGDCRVEAVREGDQGVRV